jgi:hypothetical protein
MDQSMRFEITLPVSRRQELDAFAAELGMTPTALARLAITRLLVNRALIGKSDAVRAITDTAA